MTKEDILTTFKDIVHFDDVEHIIEIDNEPYVVTISADDFLSRFGESDLTLTSLKENEMTVGGWEEKFVKLNMRGILPD